MGTSGGKPRTEASAQFQEEEEEEEGFVEEYGGEETFEGEGDDDDEEGFEAGEIGTVQDDILIEFSCLSVDLFTGP